VHFTVLLWLVVQLSRHTHTTGGVSPVQASQVVDNTDHWNKWGAFHCITTCGLLLSLWRHILLPFLSRVAHSQCRYPRVAEVYIYVIFAQLLSLLNVSNTSVFWF